MEPSTIYCKHCRKPIVAANYLIHEARCQIMSSRYVQNPSRMVESSKYYPNQKSEKEESILKKRQKIFNKREEEIERIPCSFCGYPQTLEELDTHPKICEHWEQQCQSCHGSFPRSLMNQHKQVCPMRHGHISVGQQQQFLDDEELEQEQEEFHHFDNFRPFHHHHQIPQPGFIGRRQTVNNGTAVIEQRDGRGNIRRYVFDYPNSGSQRGSGSGMNQNPFFNLFALINAFAARNSQPDQGLTKEQLRKLEKISYKCNNSTGEKDLCTICYCQFEDKQKVIRLRCKHLYHEECIVKWLQKNGRCPVCKQPQTNRPLSHNDD